MSKLIRVWMGYSQMVLFAEDFCAGDSEAFIPRDGDLAIVGCGPGAVGQGVYGDYVDSCRPRSRAITLVTEWFHRNPTAVVFAKKGTEYKAGEEWKVELAALLTLDDFESAFRAAMAPLERGYYEIPVGNKPFIEEVLERMPSYEVMR